MGIKCRLTGRLCRCGTGCLAAKMSIIVFIPFAFDTRKASSSVLVQDLRPKGDSGRSRLQRRPSSGLRSAPG